MSDENVDSTVKLADSDLAAIVAAGGGGGGGGPVTVADGADVALGTTSDAATANTVVGRLKKIVSLLPSALGGHGGMVVEGVASGTAIPGSVADGSNVALGTTTDASNATTVIGRLQKLVALLPTALGSHGGLVVEGVASGVAMPTSAADGTNVAIGTTTDAAAATTVIGRLQKLVALLPTALGANGGLKVEGVASGVAMSVDTELAAAAALADGAANPTVPTVGAAELLWNGATFDRRRSNQDVAVLASAARTTTQTGADTTNHNSRGIHLIVDVTVAGTGSITPKVQGKDANGIYYDILVGAAITTTGTNVLKIYPGLLGVANAVANDIIPRTYRVVITANNANSMTYSVATSLVV